MVMGLITALWSSFLGTLGFGVLLKAPKKGLLAASVIGAVGYGIYWLVMQWGGSEYMAMFVGSMAASVLAQLAARKLKMIATVFITLAIIPLVPGLGLYRCMSYLAQGQNALGAQTGIHAMMNFLMIALGVAVGGFLPHLKRKQA